MAMLLVSAADSSPVIGIAGKDYLHYTSTNYDTRRTVADGVVLTTWNGTQLGQIDLSLGPPAFNLLEWENTSTTGYPASAAWHRMDTLFFVVEGNITVTVDEGSAAQTVKLGRSDTLWVRAGTVHSPLVPAAGGCKVITAITPFDPLLSAPPTPPPEITRSSDAHFRTYLDKDAKRTGDPVDHFQWNSNTLSDPSVLNVIWKPNTSLPLHYHAEGALYIPSWGKLCFAGEKPSPCRVGGEARWTRPGYRYAGEATLEDEGTQIIVLNTESPPNFSDESPADFVSAKHISVNTVSEGTPDYNLCQNRCDVSGMCEGGQTCDDLTKTYPCEQYFFPGKERSGWCDKTCQVNSCTHS